MELFKLTCATCASKLKVSQLSAIGQILACPRCGSMVQVEPPEGWTPPPELVAAAKAAAPQSAAPKRRPPPDPNLPATASVADFEDIDHLLNPQAPAPARPARTSSQPKRSPGLKSPAGQVSPAARAPGAATSQPAGTGYAHAVPPAPDAGLSQSMRQRQKMLLLFFAVVGLLVVAASLVAYLANGFLQTRPLDSAKSSVAEENAGQSAAGGAPAGDPSGESIAANPKTNPADSDPSTPGVGVAQNLPPAPALGIPLPVALAATAGDAPPGMEAPVTPDAAAGAGESLVDVFSAFDEILKGSESQESLQAIEDTVAVDRGRIGIGEIYVRPPRDNPIDVAQNLRGQVLEYQFDQRPLIDVLRTLGQAAAVPIAIDIDPISARKISLVQPIDGQFQETSFESILSQILLPHGLGFRLVDQAVLVTLADADNPLTQKFDLAVFGSSDPQLPSQFVDFVIRTFQPGSWEPNGGAGTAVAEGTLVTISNTPAVVLSIDALYQKLIAAQTLRDDPENAEAQRVIASRYQRARPAREAGIVLQLLDQQPIETVFAQIGREFGPQVLVDWPAIIPEGWTGSTEIPWKTSGESLNEYLDQLANSMQLYIRSVDAQTLQLTSLVAAKERPELEVYSCAKLLQKYSAETLRERLDRLFESEIQPTTVFLEPGCQCLVAFVPQPLQIRLEAALQSLE